jgi:DNA-binding transcriptional regulator GbsR (MarR family)
MPTPDASDPTAADAPAPDALASDPPAAEGASAEGASADAASADADAPSPQHERAVQAFVDFWGEMASNWGINRTMAQIHALLYCSERPLNTDDIMARLDISRGNANMNLRSLTDWNLVAKTRLPGSRKDFYVAEKDVWAITAQIIKERERREIKPVRRQLEDCTHLLLDDRAEDVAALPDDDQVLHRRLTNLLRLVEVFEGFSSALLPFVQRRDLALIQQLVAFAGSMDPPGDR